MHKKVMAAWTAGWLDGAMKKPATPSRVPGFAVLVAAYTKGWAKGWTEMTKHDAWVAATYPKGT